MNSLIVFITDFNLILPVGRGREEGDQGDMGWTQHFNGEGDSEGTREHHY